MGDSLRQTIRAKLALSAEQAFGLRQLPMKLLPPAVSPATRASVRDHTTAPAARPPARPPARPTVGQPARPLAELPQGSTARPPASQVPAAQPVAARLPSKPPAPRKLALPAAAPPLLQVPFTSPLLPTDAKQLKLREMDANEVKGCTKCGLCATRTNTVFGEGDPDAAICFIGEGPGENEDLQGRPFVGRAGDLLGRMIAGMGLRREQVFIANIVKCRPPENREPMPEEIAACTPYLERQLEIIRPRVIVTLGKPATHHMLHVKTPISKLRGTWHAWRGIRLMPTFHPAYILRNYTSATRAAVWGDLKLVMTEIGLPVQSPGDR